MVLVRLAPDYMSTAVIGSTVPRNVVGMEAAASGEERCVTALRTAPYKDYGISACENVLPHG